MPCSIVADFATEPYAHQYKEYEEHADTEARALLWQMRTGKTKAVIDSACWMRREGLIDTVIVIAPNGVHRNWLSKELPMHHWHSMDRDTLYWDTEVAAPTKTKEKKRGWKEQNKAFWDRAARMMELDRLAWFSFASQTVTRADVRKLIALILKKRNNVMLVVDESHDYGKPGTSKSKMVRALAKRCKVRRILTASITTESPLRAWAQYELLEHGALGFDRYVDFKNRYANFEMRKNGQYQYEVVSGYKNQGELKESMAKWSSVVLRKDCEDMPDVVYRDRYVEPTEEQLRVYREMHTSFSVNIGGEEVEYGEVLRQLNKLQQVMSGFVKTPDGDIVFLKDGNPRLDALMDEVDMCSGKFIVWCQFREDIKLVSRRLELKGIKHALYHGGISGSNKEQSLYDFRCDPECVGLVGTAAAGGMGLDLSVADFIFWYSHTFNGVHKEQGDERATKVGHENVDCCHFMMPGVDHHARSVTSKKMDLAEDLSRSGLQSFIERIAI